MKILIALALTILSSCNTITVSNADTHGTASDTIDDSLSANPTVTPSVTIPVSALK